MEEKSVGDSVDWISVEHPGLERREKYTNLVPALPMLLIFSILPVMLYYKFEQTFYAIIAELIVIIISFIVWRLGVNSWGRWITKIKYTKDGYMAKARNGKIDIVKWGDTHSLNKIGPGDFGDIIYMASYRKQKKITWFSKYFGTPYAEAGTLIPESILQDFYSRWSSYYIMGGKYRWIAKEKHFVGNQKRLFIYGLLVMVGNLFVTVFFLEQLPLIGIILNATFLAGGFVATFIGGFFYAARKGYLSAHEKTETDDYPDNVHDYLVNYQITS